MEINFIMNKRLTLLSLNYYEGLIYLLNIFFAHLFLNLLIFYVVIGLYELLGKPTT
jgi:hypothetical protein